MTKMWQIEPSVDDLEKGAILTNTIASDPLVYRLFPSVELAHDALDDFCERTGLEVSLFSVQKGYMSQVYPRKRLTLPNTEPTKRGFNNAN